MEPSRDAALFATLESLRPTPAPAFAAELDARAADGFPRRSRSRFAPLDRALARVRATPPRRLLLPAGGLAITAIAVATAVVAVSSSDHSELRADLARPQVIKVEGSEGRTEEASAGVENERFVPSTKPLKENFEAAGGATSASSAKAGSAAEETGSVRSSPGAAGIMPMSENFNGTASFTPAHRDVQRSAQVVLGTAPDAVADATGKVLAAVHDSHGIVLNSSVHSGSEGGAGAAFELLIPSAKLSDTLAAFSEIAEVRYRHEGTADITAPTESTRELLQDSHARVESLLNELAEAETETEREVAETKLRGERRRAAALKSSLSRLERRADLSLVRLRIKTNAAPSSGSGGWDIGDAFHDAGHILAIAAGVAIVGLAVIGPIALIALLIWLANRAWVRQRRERALG